MGAAKPSASIFSQKLDRAAFTVYFLGAIVPLIALAVVVERYVLRPRTSRGSRQPHPLVLVAVLSGGASGAAPDRVLLRGWTGSLGLAAARGFGHISSASMAASAATAVRSARSPKRAPPSCSRARRELGARRARWSRRDPTPRLPRAVPKRSTSSGQLARGPLPARGGNSVVRLRRCPPPGDPDCAWRPSSDPYRSGARFRRRAGDALDARGLARCRCATPSCTIQRNFFTRDRHPVTAPTSPLLLRDTAWWPPPPRTGSAARWLDAAVRRSTGVAADIGMLLDASPRHDAKLCAKHTQLGRAWSTHPAPGRRSRRSCSTPTSGSGSVSDGIVGEAIPLSRASSRSATLSTR